MFIGLPRAKAVQVRKRTGKADLRITARISDFRRQNASHCRRYRGITADRGRRGLAGCQCARGVHAARQPQTRGASLQSLCDAVQEGRIGQRQAEGYENFIQLPYPQFHFHRERDAGQVQSCSWLQLVVLVTLK